MKHLFGINFAAPHHTVWGILFLLIVVCVIYWVRRSYAAIRVLRPMRDASQMVRSFSPRMLCLRALLLIIGCAALCIAIMRPQWGVQQETIAQEGRDIFVVLDISRSMLAVDCEPNRLAVAKKKVRALLSSLSCERVGLILFSGSAFVQCPLTADYPAFFMFLDHIDVETISSGTTALDSAIKKSLEAFGAAPDRKNKIVLIITDGEDFSSDLSDVKQEAARMGLHIFTLGIGTVEGAPIPLFDERGNSIGHQKDKKGAVVISRLNEELLQSLSADSGGTYIRATEDDSDMVNLAKRVAQYEKERFEDKKVTKYEDRYALFLAISFFCFLLEWLL